MVLSLDLQVSQSATFSSCDLSGATFSIAPNFTLKPVTIASQPTNVNNGRLSGIRGFVNSVNASSNSLSVVTPDGTALTIGGSGNTVYQGVLSLSGLSMGQPIDLDSTIQSDGSLLASRIEVVDPNPTSVSSVSGPVLNVAASTPVMALFGREQQGLLFPVLEGGGLYYSFDQATFQISGQFPNLQNLPFVARFTGANIFPARIFTSALTQRVCSSCPPHILR